MPLLVPDLLSHDLTQDGLRCARARQAERLSEGNKVRAGHVECLQALCFTARNHSLRTNTHAAVCLTAVDVLFAGEPSAECLSQRPPRGKSAPQKRMVRRQEGGTACCATFRLGQGLSLKRQRMRKWRQLAARRRRNRVSDRSWVTDRRPSAAMRGCDCRRQLAGLAALEQGSGAALGLLNTHRGDVCSRAVDAGAGRAAAGN